MSDGASMSPPSTEPTPTVPSGSSSWPTVLGVIGIVFAIFGLLSNFCSFFMTPSFLKSMLPEEMYEQMVSQLPSQSIILFSSIVGFILSLWLLWGSMKLLKRDASARGSLNAWAVIAIIYAIITFIWTISSQTVPGTPPSDTNTSQVSEDGGGQDGEIETSGSEGTDTDSSTLKAEQLQQINVYVSGCCGGIFTCVWPIILLVFLNTGRYKAEIENWQNNE